MAGSRYRNRAVTINMDEGYAGILDRRGEVSLEHYQTPNMISPPSGEFLSNLRIEKFTWVSNYKMWKLAADHYGDPSYWWVIAWFNSKPTDAHFSLGDPVLVPFPLASVLSYHGI